MNSIQIEQYYKSALYALENNDEKTFLKNINIACQHNHVDALLQLGIYYQERRIEPEKMIECWIKSSDLGDSDASYNLGREYWRRKDYVYMEKYYNDCIANGDYDAAYQLACYYRDLDDNKLMTHYANIGASNNHKMCQELLDDDEQFLDHIFYRNGVESDKRGNYEDAVKYYKKSIALGEAKGHTKSTVASMFNLGLLYQNLNNMPFAIYYFSMAVDFGSLEAPINLGLYYSKIKNYVNMKKYFLIGIERGCQKCMSQMMYHSFQIKNKPDWIKYFIMRTEKEGKDITKIDIEQLSHDLDTMYEGFDVLTV